MKMIKYFGIIGMLITVSCHLKNSWKPDGTILLDGITPIGISTLEDQIWLSDGNNNRLVHIDRSGQIQGDPIEIERPMHLCSADGQLFIPSYGIDQILIMNNGAIDTMQIQDSLDAPAAVDVSGDHIAIADFYNHRVLLKSDNSWKVIGGKGKANGEMHYPTDVQFFGDKLYVADAYNNRGQIFDLAGTHIQTFGQDMGLNAATGIYVTEQNIYLTDFENNRVLIFDHDGHIDQIIEGGLSNPADIAVIDNQLWILNFSGKYISTYQR